MHTMIWGFGTAVLLIGAAALMPIAPAAAQDTGGASPSGAEIEIDLNRLEQLDRGCRIDLVITNGLDSNVTRFEVDWVFFDQDGVISNRAALGCWAALPPCGPRRGGVGHSALRPRSGRDG